MVPISQSSNCWGWAGKHWPGLVPSVVKQGAPILEQGASYWAEFVGELWPGPVPSVVEQGAPILELGTSPVQQGAGDCWGWAGRL